MLPHWCYACKRYRFLYDIENIEPRHWSLGERNNSSCLSSFPAVSIPDE